MKYDTILKKLHGRTRLPLRRCSHYRRLCPAGFGAAKHPTLALLAPQRPRLHRASTISCLHRRPTALPCRPPPTAAPQPCPLLITEPPETTHAMTPRCQPRPTAIPHRRAQPRCHGCHHHRVASTAPQTPFYSHQ